jgi:hypothetical protein
LAEQGVIAESIISFAITWKNPGNGQQPIWDQTKQSIEIHETDVYPDLKYSSAYAAPQYVKYTSGSLLNELIVEINKIIDAKIAVTKKDQKKEKPAKNEAALPPGPPAPKALGSGEDDEEEDSTQKALPTGPSAPKQLGQGSPGGALVKYDQPQPPAVIDNKPEDNDEPEVNAEVNDDEPKTTASGEYAYTVVVYGDKLRFMEGQQERGAYSAGVKFLYKISNNLSKKISGEQIDNTSKIWAEISMPGVFGDKFKMQFAEFNESEFRFGGNLLAQILPSVELSFTPEINTVYSKEKPELDLADVIKATNITLGSKSTSEIKSIQKQIQKELEVREPDQKEMTSAKQVDQDKNK